MKHQLLARHTLEMDDQGRIVTTTGEPFDTVQYGLMKFGSLDSCRDIGVQLGHFLLDEASDVVLDRRPICAPFMYKHVPSAAYNIATYAFAIVNAARAELGLDRVHVRQIYIRHQPNADYARLGLEARRRYMEDSGLQLISEPLDGYTVLLLDDVRITGNYASLVRDMVGRYDIDTMLEVYWAYFCPERNPELKGLEYLLNSSAGHGLDLMKAVLESGHVKPTLRTLKLLLSTDDPDSLRTLLLDLPDWLLVDLYEGAVGTGHDLSRMYPRNYQLLCQLAESSPLLARRPRLIESRG